jgi:HEAT repeat protein
MLTAMSTPDQLRGELEAAGVSNGDVWWLVNTSERYPAAIPVLLEWLAALDERVPAEGRELLREGIVRALTVAEARPVAAPLLIDQFRQVADPNLRWVIGNALEVVADDSVFDQAAELATQTKYGTARQMVVLGFGRSNKPEAVPLLIALLDDDDVAAHAAMALGRLKAPEAQPALERQLASPRPLVRREARKALARISEA